MNLLPVPFNSTLKFVVSILIPLLHFSGTDTLMSTVTSPYDSVTYSFLIAKYIIHIIHVVKKLSDSISSVRVQIDVQWKSRKELNRNKAQNQYINYTSLGNDLSCVCTVLEKYMC